MTLSSWQERALLGHVLVCRRRAGRGRRMERRHRLRSSHLLPRYLILIPKANFRYCCDELVCIGTTYHLTTAQLIPVAAVVFGTGMLNGIFTWRFAAASVTQPYVRPGFGLYSKANPSLQAQV